MLGKLKKSIANLTLRQKFGIILGIACLAILSTYAGLTYLTTFQFRTSLLSDLRSLAELLGDLSQDSLKAGKETVVSNHLEALKRRNNIISAAIYKRDGERLASYLKTGVAVDPLPQTFAGAMSVQWEEKQLFVHEVITANGKPLGIVSIVSNLEALQNRLAMFFVLGGLIGIFAQIVAILSSKQLQGFISQPIIYLSEMSKKLATEKNYNLRVNEDILERLDEVGQLARNFNSMLIEIQERDESLRQAMAEADAATKSKAELLTNMSHEIRTPLTNIIGALEMVQDLPPKLSPAQTESMQMALSSSEILVTVIDDILDFSKIEVGELKIETETFNIRKHLNQALAPLFARGKARGITAGIEVYNNVPGEVSTDKTRLGQILINLLSYALKQTTPSSALGLKVCLASDSADVSSKNTASALIQFEIWYDGTAIPEEKRLEAFKPFTQISSTADKNSDSAGLSLTVAQQLVSLMGGKMWIGSEEGACPRFFFTIADQRETRTQNVGIIQQQVYSLTADSIKKLKVLVVDDNALGRTIAEHRLKKFGHEVTVAENGAQAIEQVQGGSFDLILMDCVMPVMDGFEATRHIRELEKSKPTKTAILAMTANNAANYSASCVEAGMDGYISKPVIESELMASLDCLLAAEKDISPPR